MAEPWLKLDTSITSNPKVMTLPSEVFKFWICMLCETKLYGKDGVLPPNPRLAFALHIHTERMAQMLDTLVEARLVDDDGEELRVHDWEDWQHLKPSARPEAIRERVGRHRASLAVTPRNTLNGVTESVTPCNTRNATRLEKSREEKKRGEGEPPNPPRGARIPQMFPLLPSMEEYAATKGVSKSAAHEHLIEFHRHFLQTVKNPTSRDWVGRWQNSLSRDLREGRVKPDLAVARLAEAEPMAMTPAEQGYVTLRGALNGEEATEAVLEVAERLGGIGALRTGGLPTYATWVAAWNSRDSIG